MNRISQFLICCSGITQAILKKSPTERNKYIGLGATILFTGIFATLAATYAITLLSSNLWVALSIGVVWGLMIFNLDRLIISSLRKTGYLKKDLMAVMPRIILAVFISLVIATPLELRLFEGEIEDELTLMNQASYQHQLTQLNIHYDSLTTKINQEIKDLKVELSEKEVQRNQLMEIAQSEADGTGGSGLKNLGPIYKVKKENMNKVNRELDTLKTVNSRLIQQKRAQIESLVEKEAIAIDGIIKPQAKGIAARMVALEHISSKSSVIFWIELFLTLLFILVETTPILLKLMMPKGPYDVITESLEDQIIERYKH